MLKLLKLLFLFLFLNQCLQITVQGCLLKNKILSKKLRKGKIIQWIMKGLKKEKLKQKELGPW